MRKRKLTVQEKLIIVGVLVGAPAALLLPVLLWVGLIPVPDGVILAVLIGAIFVTSKLR